MNVGVYYKLVLQAFPVIRFPGDAPSDEAPVSYIYRQIKQDLSARLDRFSLLPKVFAIAVWPFMAFGSIVHMLILNGRIVKRRSGRSIAGQFKDQIDLSFRRGVFPHYYYMYELYLDDRRNTVFDYLIRPVIKPYGAYNLVYTQNPSFVRAPALRDKTRFVQFCRDNELPTAGIYAEFNSGTISWSDPDSARLPERNIFVKPRKGKGGRGAELWRFADGLYTNSKGVSLDAPLLLDRLCALSRRRTSPLGRGDYGNAESWLAVEHCTNHADLLDLSTGALNTLRIVTCRNTAGGIEHIVTILRMAQDRSKVVDNCHAGGLAAMVDPETGILGPATDDGVSARLGWLDRHPVTGAQITGRKVPLWSDALSLAYRAHEALGPVPFVGWDIGILESGPCLIEGNSAPCIEIEQRVAGPLGNARFGELLAKHIRNERQFEIGQPAAD